VCLTRWRRQMNSTDMRAYHLGTMNLTACKYLTKCDVIPFISGWNISDWTKVACRPTAVTHPGAKLQHSGLKNWRNRYFLVGTWMQKSKLNKQHIIYLMNYLYIRLPEGHRLSIPPRRPFTVISHPSTRLEIQTCYITAVKVYTCLPTDTKTTPNARWWYSQLHFSISSCVCVSSLLKTLSVKMSNWANRGSLR